MKKLVLILVASLGVNLLGASLSFAQYIELVEDTNPRTFRHFSRSAYRSQ